MNIKKIMVILFLIILTGCTLEQTNEILAEEHNDKESISGNTDNAVIPAEPELIAEPKPVLHCNDGTIYSECSGQKPYYCAEGNIIKKATKCGCPENYIAENENCIYALEITPEQRTYTYILRGKQDSISTTVYKEMDEYLSAIPRTYYCDPECPSSQEKELKYTDNPEQKQRLLEIAGKIKEKTTDKAERARIAISFVQSMPYADGERRRDDLTGRYPYEVLYDQKGVCGEKSALLAFLLREIGYGTALFRYIPERHMTVGIKCPLEYSYKNTGYCFIETTEPIMATYVPKEYVEIGELKSEPEIIQINNGESFDSVKEEYGDARELERINKLGLVLEPKDYASWRDLMKKYGIHAQGSMFYK